MGISNEERFVEYYDMANSYNKEIDMVNHPKHYTSDPSGVECIDITRHRNFNVGNAIKYLWRAGLKEDSNKSIKKKQIEDLQKSVFYINDEIKRLAANFKQLIKRVMGRPRKVIYGKPTKPPVNLHREYEVLLPTGQSIVLDELFKVKGINATNFMFKAYVTNVDTGMQWVECIELLRGRYRAWRFFYIDRIKKIPVRRRSVSDEQKIVEHLDEVNKVVGKYLEGNDPTQISKELSIPRQKVVAHIKEWQYMAADNAAIRARAKEALVAADTHYTKLIQKAYEVIDDATTTANLSAKNAGIKLVLDIESRRIEMLQKAGLLENKELAEEMLEIESKQEVLVNILKDIASEYPQVRDEIMRRLSNVAKESEVITVVRDVQ